MSTIKDDGGPAFPTDHVTQTPGMSLRDYFAAEAMQLYFDPCISTDTVTRAAKAAYRAADEMIKARSA